MKEIKKSKLHEEMQRYLYNLNVEFSFVHLNFNYNSNETKCLLETRNTLTTNILTLWLCANSILYLKSSVCSQRILY